MIIDSHAHVMLPQERLIGLMDEAGIDRTVLCYTSIHPEQADSTAAFEEEMRVLGEVVSGKRNQVVARAAGIEEQCRVISRYPTRFLGFGTVPIGLSGEDTRSWIKANVVGKGFKGIGELTPASGQVSRLENVFDAAAEVGRLPLWIHTFSPLAFEDLLEIDALSRKYPQVPVILGHSGGVHWLEAIRLAKANRSLYLDLSGTYTAFTPKLAIKELPDRTLFSSDAPYGEPLLAKAAVERATEDRAVRERVLGGNLEELLNL